MQVTRDILHPAGIGVENIKTYGTINHDVQLSSNLIKAMYVFIESVRRQEGGAVKLVIEQSAEYDEPEIKILCSRVDRRLSRLIEHINLFSSSIDVKKDNSVMSVALDAVFYFDTVDNRVFLYTENDVCQCGNKLYEIEAAYADTSLMRVSKNCILNIFCVASVRTQLSGRLEATLKNGEKVIISRHYIKAFRDKFMRKEDSL
jgi:DNA-binding LytR/AlgR family response regulator